ncbi:hypothetical protein BASA61_009442 [Batrachochytrium salamandrivorans]|nr:hypothetical protein BASA60_003773 [Batrachochytrium salamandrivorans]KAH6580768.1 hypothetical protein BASA61_009442 [Batrachochytrium salamandrivorans]KAH9266623.1 hypothetical protein BASA83_010427 [Batrachochytrium salamandrivorans]
MDHQQPRYWCHICQAQVDANLHGLTPNCLLCNSEFIEEIEEASHPQEWTGIPASEGHGVQSGSFTMHTSVDGMPGEPSIEQLLPMILQQLLFTGNNTSTEPSPSAPSWANPNTNARGSASATSTSSNTTTHGFSFSGGWAGGATFSLPIFTSSEAPRGNSSSAEGTTRDPYTAAEGTPQSHTINQEGTHTFSFEYSHPADPNLGSAGHAGSETQTQPDQNHSNFPSEANHNLSEEGLSLEEQMLRRMFRRFSGNMNPNTTSSQDSRLATIAPILIQLLGIRGSLGDYVADGDSFEDIITRLFEQHTQGSDTQAAPSNIIASLPKEKFSKGTSSQTECAICQDEYIQDELLISLPCTHIYHPDCITSWLKLNGTCPICRFSFVDHQNNNTGDAGVGSHAENAGVGSHTENAEVGDDGSHPRIYTWDDSLD